ARHSSPALKDYRGIIQRHAVRKNIGKRRRREGHIISLRIAAFKVIICRGYEIVSYSEHRFAGKGFQCGTQIDIFLIGTERTSRPEVIYKVTDRKTAVLTHLTGILFGLTSKTKT